MSEMEIEEIIEEHEDQYLDEVADFVMRQFDRAKRHRDDVGITEAIVDSLRRYRGKYADCDRMKFDGIDIYRNATGMLCRSAYNWLKDAYFSAMDKPWTLQPTPLPELPEEMKNELEEAIKIRFQQIALQVAQTGEQPDSKKDVLLSLKNTASRLAFEAASEATKGMEKLIEDQMIESEFRNVLNDFLMDVVVYPYAALKGPVVRYKDIAVWDKNKYKFKKESAMYTERVDPYNLYLSPDSTNAQDGEFLIEMIPTTRASLNSSRKMKGFNEDMIDLIINEQSHASYRNPSVAVDDNELENLDGVGRTAFKTDGHMFDVYEYHGRISGENIIELIDEDGDLDYAMNKPGTTVETPWGDINPYEDYEAIIRVCNGITYMLRMNEELPVPSRGYFVTSYSKVPGSYAGQGVPMMIADEQDEINMAARARYYNAGMSSGPIAEADVSRFQDNEIPESVTPWQIFPVTTNSMQGNNNAKAINFTNIPNESASLTAFMEEVWDKMHRISGIPPYMYGDSRGSAQTLGAFSLQYAGATKGIKTVISNIDQDVIESLITQYYYYNMVFHEDDTIKVDAKVNVRGSSGLIAQEQRQSRPLELLQALGPVLAQLDPQKALALSNEVLSESGYDPETFGSASGDAQSELAARQVTLQQPQVDGRSSGAVNAAQNANLPPQQLTG